MTRTVEERQPMWILQSSEPADAVVTFRLRAGAVKTIGRAPQAQFVIDAPLVSRLHCRVTAAADTVEVVDLSSTNGTYVNGKRVKCGQLKSGDRLRVGRVELSVEKKTHG